MIFTMFLGSGGFENPELKDHRDREKNKGFIDLLAYLSISPSSSLANFLIANRPY